MVKTKQTAHGGSSSRQVGMQVARFGDKPEEGQFIEVQDDEDEENWPDLDVPRKGKEVGESSKSTGKEGDQPAPQAKGNPNPTTQYKLKKELQQLLQQTPIQLSQHPCRTPPMNPKIPKQVLSQMSQVSKSM